MSAYLTTLDRHDQIVISVQKLRNVLVACRGQMYSLIIRSSALSAANFDAEFEFRTSKVPNSLRRGEIYETVLPNRLRATFRHPSSSAYRSFAILGHWPKIYHHLYRVVARSSISDHHSAKLPLVCACTVKVLCSFVPANSTPKARHFEPLQRKIAALVQSQELK